MGSIYRWDKKYKPTLALAMIVITISIKVFLWRAVHEEYFFWEPLSQPTILPSPTPVFQLTFYPLARVFGIQPTLAIKALVFVSLFMISFNLNFFNIFQSLGQINWSLPYSLVSLNFLNLFYVVTIWERGYDIRIMRFEWWLNSSVTLTLESSLSSLNLCIFIWNIVSYNLLILTLGC